MNPSSTLLSHLFVLATIVVIQGMTVAAATDVTEIVEGIDSRCPNSNDDVTTYVFPSDGIQRCFNVYKPDTDGNPQAVVIMSHGSGGNGGLFCKQDALRASFATMGVTLICTSAATVIDDTYKPTRWRAPEFGSTDVNPYPCNASDSIDVAYFETILDWIDSQPTNFDNQRIFNSGFSQGSMMASYISFCFSDRLRGMATSGSGLKVNGPAVQYCSEYDDNRNGRCQLGVTDGWRNTAGFGECEDCRFYPIMPVQSAKDVKGNPLTVCIYVGENDSRVVGSDQYRYYYERAGLNVANFTIWPNLNHAMPPDWPIVYDECLGITSSPPSPTDAPTATPVTDPTLAPTTTNSCVDDPDWRFRGRNNRDCNWIASRNNVLTRCRRRANNPNTDTTKVRVYCKATCNAAGDALACPQ